MELDPQGVEHEFTFWKGFVQSDRFQLDWCSNTKTNELNQVVYDKLQEIKPEKVLDVGSGPVSILRGSVPHVITCDPLSTLYQKIVDFKAKGIDPPEIYAAEDLPEKWREYFDVVHCSNALDHTVDPIISFKKLYSCVKPGGYIIIQGFENEAVYEEYAGFHQWNLSLNSTKDGIVVGSRDGMETISAFANPVIADSFTIAGGRGPRTWFIFILQKLAKWESLGY